LAVLVPRHRTIGVRLSEEEYAALETFCVRSAARSISDLARSAIASFLKHEHQENALTSTVNHHAAQVRELEQKVESLSAEIALLRASSALRQGSKKRGSELKIEERLRGLQPEEPPRSDR
jgi:TolA-binding protein